MNFRWLGAACALLSFGCGSGAVRQLTKNEQDYMLAVAQRVDAHRSAVQALLADLRAIERQFAFEERQNTTTAVAQAKLLESMQAPWAAPSASLETTQRAVILFHLYDLLGQEKVLFDAEQAERDAERRQVLDAYDQLAELLKATLEDEKIVLEYVNQPADSQIAEIVDETLAEARVANEALAKSSDRRLQKLAGETERIAERVEQAKKSIQDALAAVKSAKKK